MKRALPVFAFVLLAGLFFGDAVIIYKNLVQILGMPAARGMSNEVWITTGRTDTRCGANGHTGCYGTPEDPFDGSGTTGTKLASVWATIPANAHVRFGPGTFWTSTPLTVLTGQTIEGGGIGVTTIKMVDQGAAAFTQEKYIFMNGLNFALSGTRVSGITFDCNVGGQSSTTANIGAVQIYGTKNITEDCVAIHFATKLSGNENFLFTVQALQGGGLAGPAYGNKILRCGAELPAAVIWADGCTAFSISATGMTSTNQWVPGGDAWQNGPEISGCWTHDITVGTGSGQPNYFHETGFGFTSGAKLLHNHATNLLSSHSDGTFTDCTGYYVDTGSNFGTIISGNTWDNVEHGVWLKIGHASHYLQNDNIITGNIIRTIGASNKGLELTGDDANPSVNMRISNNELLIASGQAVAQLTNMTDMFIEHNTMDTSYAHPIFDNGGNTVRTQTGNRKIDGTVITADFAITGP